jgi:DNA-binding response OmpR family regulator
MAVDDDRDILELIRLSLESRYEVLTFNEPIQAFQSIGLVEPDIFILDVMMPKVTGYQFLERLRGDIRFAQTPVMFLSAKDANRDIKYGYKLGATIYLTKPFQPDRLLRNMDSFFERTPPTWREKRHAADDLARRFAPTTKFYNWTPAAPVAAPAPTTVESMLGSGTPAASAPPTSRFGNPQEEELSEEEIKKRRGPLWEG